MKKQLLSLALGLSLCVGISNAQESTRLVQGKSFIEYGKSLKEIPLNADRERGFTIDAAIANDIFMSNTQRLIINDFPVGVTETKTVELRPARPVADGETKWLRNGTTTAPSPRVISYEGILEGELKSRVFLTYFKGDVTGVVIRENGQRYVVAPEVKNYSTKHEHILTSESYVLDQIGDEKFVCGTAEDMSAISNEASTNNAVKVGDRPLATNELLEANVAVDITNSFYKKFNDYEKTQAYVMSLFGMVSRIYEDELNITLHLGLVNIWDDLNSDPYKGLASGHELLPRMAKYWSDNLRNAPRHVAHLLSGPPPPGSGNQVVVGVAYLGKLCAKFDDPFGGYGVSLIYKNNLTLPGLSYISDIGTIAHEMGHNFGSPHTHTDGIGAYNPPIDSCVTLIKGHPAYAGDATWNGEPKPPSNGIGTIMSYCHLRFENTMQFVFGPLPGEKIRAGAEKCLSIPAQPKIFIQYPVGMQNLIAGAQEEIRWTSARVSSVNIQYSINNGNTWIDVQTGVLATDRKISWMVPQISSSEVLVRVVDASNGQVYDQTEATLSVAKPTISLTRPTGGERFGQNEQLNITWNKQLVNSVDIAYSIDGQKWETIAEDVTSNSYNWTIPAITAPQTVVRITDSENGQVVSESAPFAIGVATATIISPNGGEKFAKGYNLGIAWTADFVSRIYIEYSTDNGVTWTNIRKPAISIDASLGYYKWTIPSDADTATGKVLLRIKNALQPDLTVLDETDGTFTIDLVSDVAENEIVLDKLRIMEISPNPAGEEVYVQFTRGTSEKQTPAFIDVVDVAGRVVAHFEQPSQFNGSEQTVKLNLKELPQGVYMLIVKDGMSQASATLRIVR